MTPMFIQIQRWLKQPKVWRFVGFASTVIGLVCYALSSPFNHLFKKWNLLKIFVYIVISFIICLMVLFANQWKRLSNHLVDAHLIVVIFTGSSVYSHVFEKALEGKPDAYSLVSCAAFAFMSLSLSRQTYCGFQVDLLNVFLGCLFVLLWKIHLLLAIFGGGGFAYCLTMFRYSLDAQPEDVILEQVVIQGDSRTQQQQQKNSVNILENIKKLEVKFFKQSRTSFDPSKKLNIMKKYMVQLEWYMKKTRSQGIGYYDSYKNMYSQWDHDVVVLQMKLTKYWEKIVEEVEVKPQKEGTSFRTRWLFGGTNYRRMVEPLIIAQFYRDGGRDYVTKNRPKHFEKLEEWLREMNPTATSSLNSTSRHNVESKLTLDSCFWAHVEEALLSCKELKVTKKEEARNKLLNFEKYVYGLLRNYAVSPEIFLPQSSYIRWWAEYKEIKGSSYDSKLASFMSNARNYEQYAVGAFDFH